MVETPGPGDIALGVDFETIGSTLDRVGDHVVGAVGVRRRHLAHHPGLILGHREGVAALAEPRRVVVDVFNG